MTSLLGSAPDARGGLIAPLASAAFAASNSSGGRDPVKCVQNSFTRSSSCVRAFVTSVKQEGKQQKSSSRHVTEVDRSYCNATSDLRLGARIPPGASFFFPIVSYFCLRPADSQFS